MAAAMRIGGVRSGRMMGRSTRLVGVWTKIKRRQNRGVMRMLGLDQFAILLRMVSDTALWALGRMSAFGSCNQPAQHCLWLSVQYSMLRRIASRVDSDRRKF